jgi:hypothetical protein
VSSGTSSNLTAYQAPVAFVLPSGKKPADIVAIGIAGSNDHVYTWYADGTATEGTSSHLAQYHGPYAYKLPAGLSPADIVEMDIAKDDHVYAWYRNGTASSGTSGVLDKYLPPFGYIPEHVIYRWWGASPLRSIRFNIPLKASPTDSELPANLPKLPNPVSIPGNAEPRDAGAAGVSPSPALKVESGGALDVMVAAGSHFMIASDTSSLLFTDKNGEQLPQSPGGVPTSISSNDFFAGFVADTEADGSFNWGNINKHVGFSKNCTSYPATQLNHFCIGEFYDTRAYFDRGSQRFFVISAARNYIWSNFSDQFKQANGGNCGFYQTDQTHKIYMSNPSDCGVERRLVAVAVSKTEDPRDGFYQYMLTSNTPADWPWAAIHGSRVVISHHGGTPGPPEWPTQCPIAIVLDTTALASGTPHPPHFMYFANDLNGMSAVMAPNQQGDAETMNYLLANDGTTLRIFGLAAGGDGWSGPALRTASVDLGNSPPDVLSASYRGTKLYLAGTELVEQNGPANRYSIRVIRIPLNHISGGLTVSQDPSAGYVDHIFGRNAPDDNPNDRISYETPSLAVNGHGDMLIGYRRNPFVSAAPLFPQARYSLWRASDAAPLGSRLLRQGDAPCTDKIDYTTVVVDSSDDSSFWAALPFADSVGHYNRVIGKITP